MDVRSIITGELTNALGTIRDNMESKGVNASHRTSKSLRVEDRGDSIVLVIGGDRSKYGRTAPLETLEIGSRSAWRMVQVDHSRLDNRERNGLRVRFASMGGVHYHRTQYRRRWNTTPPQSYRCLFVGSGRHKEQHPQPYCGRLPFNDKYNDKNDITWQIPNKY